MILKKMIKALSLVVLTLAMLFQGLNSINLPKAYASTTTVVDTTPKSFSVGQNGSYNMNYQTGTFDLEPSISSIATITRIKGTYYISGSGAIDGTVQFGSQYNSYDGQMNNYFNSNYPTPVYSPGPLLVNGGTARTVTNFDVSFPLTGDQRGDRHIYLQAYGNTYTTYWLYVTITEIDYTVFNVDSTSVSPTSSNYLQVVLNRTDNTPGIIAVMGNSEISGDSVTGIDSLGAQCSGGAASTAGNGNITFTDSQVALDKTYTENISLTYGDFSEALSATGSVPSPATVAAQAAQAAANSAASAAQNALNGTNTIINSYLSSTAGVVQDSSGTVLNAARLAQTNAQNAYNSANQADTDIKAAQTNLSNQLGNLQTNMTNNFNNLSQYLTPNLKKISGSNGATATSGSSMQLVLDYSNATDYRYSVDGGGWSSWSALSGTEISVPLSTQGSHTITVQIRNGSGSTAPTDQSSINVFKL